MRIYISGKMTGCPDLNRPAFDAAEKRLTAQGHFVINPHRISALFGTADAIARSFEYFYDNEDGSKCHAYYYIKLACAVMDADLAAVRSCDAIYLLRGWETSRGAKKELAEAFKCGLEVRQEGGEE
jgi:hypothetical protein